MTTRSHSRVEKSDKSELLEPWLSEFAQFYSFHLCLEWKDIKNETFLTSHETDGVI